MHIPGKFNKLIWCINLNRAKLGFFVFAKKCRVFSKNVNKSFSFGSLQLMLMHISCMENLMIYLPIFFQVALLHWFKHIDQINLNHMCKTTNHNKIRQSTNCVPTSFEVLYMIDFPKYTFHFIQSFTVKILINVSIFRYISYQRSTFVIWYGHISHDRH